MGVYLTGVRLMGVYLMGVQLIGVYLMGVHLIDVYFMDVYVFPNPKRLWGNPPDPPPYKRWSICLDLSCEIRVFVLRDKIRELRIEISGRRSARNKKLRAATPECVLEEDSEVTGPSHPRTAARICSAGKVGRGGGR
jgi:hypothetical protein